MNTEQNDLQFVRVASQVFGCPLLIRQREAEIIGSYVRARMHGAGPDANRFSGTEQFDPQTGRWKGYRKADSVGIVTIVGELVNRGAHMGASSGLVSYEGIGAQITAAAKDREVASIILDLQSPGGQAVGMNETARLIRRVSAEKPVTAVVNGMAASAAYGLATGASEIVTTESGVSGSIGVVLLHLDQSKRMEELGVRATLIHAGTEKVVGNPFGPLSDEDREILQQEVDVIMNGFVRLVSDHRSNLSEQDVRALEAGIRIGEDAVRAGLADRVGSFEQVLSDLSRGTGRTNSQKGMYPMSEKTNGEPAAETAGISKADHDKALADAKRSAIEEGRQAERDRIAGIDAQAKGLTGHDDLVAEMKADGSTTPEQAAVRLLAAEKAKPKKDQANLDERLRGLDKLDAAADGVQSSPSETGAVDAEQSFDQTPDGWKAEWAAKEELRKRFPTAESYAAAMKRDAGKRAA